MPRRRVAPRIDPVRRGPAPSHDQVVTKSDAAWHVRTLRGSSSGKQYRCPGCHQVVTAVTPHVLVWPVVKPLLTAEAIDERRHWHTPCWNRRP